MKRALLIGALAAAGLAGCASGPYYDSYGYGPSYSPYYADYGAYGAPGFYDSPYATFGYWYYDNDGRRHWRERHDHPGRDWRDRGGNPGWHDRGGDHGWRDGRLYGGNAVVEHGEMGNEAGMGSRGGGSSSGPGGGGQQ